MRRLFAAFAVVAGLMAAPNFANAQLTTEQQASLNSTLTGAGTTQEKAQAVANLLAGANAQSAQAIANLLVANGNAALIATVLNAEGAATGGASAIAAIATALGQSPNATLVASVLGSVGGGLQSNVAGMVKAAATAAGNNAVLALTLVSNATAPVQIVNFTPPPPLVVNPNQVVGSPS
jgi:hypothetical protein